VNRQSTLGLTAFRQFSQLAMARALTPRDTAATSSVRSFDVFDTLITRVWFQPTDLFLAVAAELKEFGLFEGSETEWQTIRISAERRCANRRGKNEATLDEIYADIATECGWTPGQEHLAKVIELRGEIRGLRPIASTVEQFRQVRAQTSNTILLSDTYFSAGILRHMLERCGIDCTGEQLFCSSSHDATKRNGSLYGIVVARFGADRSEIAHCGDNAYSDFLKPRQLGIDATLFEGGAPSRYEKAMYASKSGSPIVRSAIAGCARAARLRENLVDEHARTIWQTSANVAGPLLTGFVLWTLMCARERGQSTLYYLARDGQILQRIAVALAAWLNWPIECKYLLASRKALFLPSLAASPDELVARILERDEGQDLAATSALIGLDLGALARRVNPDDADNARSIKELLEICKPQILEKAQRQRAALRRYLIQQGFSSPGAKPILVDIGWHGNLQLHVFKTIENDEELKPAAERMTGLYFGLARKPARIADRVSTFAPFKRWLNASLIETFCAADHGSVLGYAVDSESGEVKGQLAAEKNAPLLEWGLETQQRAIMTFVDDLTSGHRASAFDVAQLLDELCSSSLKNLRRLVLSPSHAEARCYGAVKHAVDAGHSGSEEIAPAYTIGEAASTLLYGARERAGLWAEGSLTRRSSTMLERQTLLSLWNLRRVAVEVSTKAFGTGR
jgi:FMN phosphatase YigB (HAD superfamily)